jgi:uncharacterized protein YggE
MKRLIILVFVLSSVMTFAQSGPKNYLDVNFIEVTGKSIKDITPDMIYMNIILSENDGKRTSIKEREKKMMKTLASVGVNLKKDFFVKDLASVFKHYFIRRTDVKITKEYQLIVHTGAMAGKTIEALDKIGIANVSIEKLRYSKIKEVRLEAKIEAIRNAKEKAVLLTKAIGQTAGKALYIREQGDYTEYPLENRYSRRRSTMARAMPSSTAEEAPVQIEFKQIKLEYSITARFEIK